MRIALILFSTSCAVSNTDVNIQLRVHDAFLEYSSSWSQKIGKSNIVLALRQSFQFHSRWFDPTRARTPDQSLWGPAPQALICWCVLFSLVLITFLECASIRSTESSHRDICFASVIWSSKNNLLYCVPLLDNHLCPMVR